MWHLHRRAIVVASASVRPRLKVLLAALRSTLRDGAEGAASLRGGRLIGSFREGPRSAARYTRALIGAQNSHNVMNTSVTAPSTCAFKALTSEDLRRCAPSIFAAHARPGVSTRYSFVSTAQVVTLLGAEGWEPVKACEQRVRLADRMGFQMHEIRFARRADLEAGVFQVGSTRPEMILQNAHDGSRAYRIDAGLYRLVCRNGLIVADADFAHVSIRHVDVSADVFAKAARSVAETTPYVLQVVAKWQGIQLTEAARIEFARRAAALRWDAGQPVMKLLNAEKLLQPVRIGDGGTDLWSVYNVIGEHLIRGGDRYEGHIDQMGFRRNTTRPIGSLTKGVSINKSLWTLASEFANN